MSAATHLSSPFSEESIKQPNRLAPLALFGHQHLTNDEPGADNTNPAVHETSSAAVLVSWVTNLGFWGAEFCDIIGPILDANSACISVPPGDSSPVGSRCRRQSSFLAVSAQFKSHRNIIKMQTCTENSSDLHLIARTSLYYS
jgi:hypothetical protein